MQADFERITDLLVASSLARARSFEELSHEVCTDCTIPFAIIHSFICDAANHPERRCKQLNLETTPEGRGLVDVVTNHPILRKYLNADSHNGILCFNEDVSIAERIELSKYLASKTGGIA